jgi:hypothetical protein
VRVVVEELVAQRDPGAVQADPRGDRVDPQHGGGFAGAEVVQRMEFEDRPLTFGQPVESGVEVSGPARGVDSLLDADDVVGIEQAVSLNPGVDPALPIGPPVLGVDDVAAMPKSQARGSPRLER